MALPQWKCPAFMDGKLLPAFNNGLFGIKKWQYGFINAFQKQPVIWKRQVITRMKFGNPECGKYVKILRFPIIYDIYVQILFFYVSRFKGVLLSLLYCQSYWASLGSLTFSSDISLPWLWPQLSPSSGSVYSTRDLICLLEIGGWL